MALIISTSDAVMNIPLMIAGFILLIIRVITMRGFILSEKTAGSIGIENEYDHRFNGWFSPVVMHGSYFVSMIFCFAMILSFRVKVLNAITIALFPSLFISIPLKDMKIILHPEKYNTKKFSLFWWNYITVHTPMAIIGIYMFITKEFTLSKPAFYIALVMIIIIFVTLDDKDNGVLKGMAYIKAGLVVLIIWLIIAETLIFPGIPQDADPLIAPILTFSWG
jgi:hypothetical protein